MLGDLLIKPQQRITKYPLLLRAVLKRSPEERAHRALTSMVGGLAGPDPWDWGLVCGNCSPGTLEGVLSRVCDSMALTGQPVLEHSGCH